MQKKILLMLLVLMANLVIAANIVIVPGTQGIITKLNTKAKAQKVSVKPLGDIVVWSALSFLNEPYAFALLDKKTPEYLYIDLSKTDCMLFIEQILAISQLIKHNDLTLNNYTKEIEKFRYHGEIAYCNRNHYFKDWALSNQEKGSVTDEALKLTAINYPYKAEVLSHVIASKTGTPHQLDVACIKEREQKVNLQKFGFIPLKDLPKYLDKIQSGDIIGIVREPKGRADGVHHLGFAYIEDGRVGMIHASSESKKVVIAPSLMDYLHRFNDSMGIILLRPHAD